MNKSTSTFAATLTRQTYSWEFTFRDKATEKEVTAGVLGTEFNVARSRALDRVATETGGDRARFQYVRYKRLT